MDSGAAYRLFIGIFAYAVLRGALLGYWNWRRRRLAMPSSVRNAGFLTDGKLWIFERTVLSAYVINALAILAFVVWFVGSTRGWWAPY